MGICAALAEVAANSCLGGVFATLPARPFWHGGQIPIYFLTSAFLSGAAAVVIFNNFAYKLRGEQMSESVLLAMRSAGKVMILVLILYAVATFWRTVSFFVGGTNLGRTAAASLINGPLATNFWIFEVLIGIVIPLILLNLSKLKSVQMMTVAGLFILLGQFMGRYDMVVAGQIVPVNLGWDNMPAYFSYVPSLYEFGVVFGGLGLVCVGFILGERFFGKVFTQKDHH